jgi:hypothetical protein
MIDLYCERTAVGVWNEPLNLVSNLAFVIAALLSLRVYRRQPDLHAAAGWDLLLLIVLMFGIGIGSGLFHALANHWSLFADVIPIALFINLYLFSLLYRAVAAPVWAIVLLLVLYQIVGVGLGALLPAGALNGSAGYLPPALAMLIAWAWLNGRRHSLEPFLLGALLLFVLSLTLRTLDAAVCARLPIGTHFVWHLLNASVLYLLVVGLVQHGRRRRVTPAENLAS